MTELRFSNLRQGAPRTEQQVRASTGRAASQAVEVTGGRAWSAAAAGVIAGPRGQLRFARQGKVMLRRWPGAPSWVVLKVVGAPSTSYGSGGSSDVGGGPPRRVFDSGRRKEGKKPSQTTRQPRSQHGADGQRARRDGGRSAVAARKSRGPGEVWLPTGWGCASARAAAGGQCGPARRSQCLRQWPAEGARWEPTGGGTTTGSH